MNHKTFWNKIAPGYDKNTGKIYAEAYRETTKNILRHVNNSMDVLDIGCGTGIITNEIAEHVKQIRAFDISEQMVSIATNKAASAGISNVNYSVNTIEEATADSKKYDCIIACNILYLIQDIDAVLTKIYSRLNEQGLFISVTDCLGEKWSVKSTVTEFCSRLGLLPYMKSYSIQGLKQTIEKNGFKITEEKNLFPGLPNYFIVSKK